MKTTLSIIGIASLALVGFSSEALAQGPRDIRSEACLSSVPLTYHQQRQIDSFRATASYESRQVRFQIDRTEAELRALTMRHWPNRMAIARTESELRDLRAREQSIWTTYEWQVQSTLGPAQKMSMARCSSPVRHVPVVVAPIRTSRPITVVSVHTPNPRPVHTPNPRPMGRR
jgi:Spy/CpxP family protein refolding chaperone